MEVKCHGVDFWYLIGPRERLASGQENGRSVICVCESLHYNNRQPSNDRYTS